MVTKTTENHRQRSSDGRMETDGVVDEGERVLVDEKHHRVHDETSYGHRQTTAVEGTRTVFAPQLPRHVRRLYFSDGVLGLNAIFDDFQRANGEPSRDSSATTSK